MQIIARAGFGATTIFKGTLVEINTFKLIVSFLNISILTFNKSS